MRVEAGGSGRGHAMGAVLERWRVQRWAAMGRGGQGVLAIFYTAMEVGTYVGT